MEFKKCPICGEPVKILEWRELLGKNFAIVEDCPNCEKIKKSLEEENKLMRSKELLEQSNLQRKYNNITFDSIEELGFPSPSYKQAYNRCLKYCSVARIILEKGCGIYLYGDTGRGKTTIVSAMINSLVNQGFSCYINNITNLREMLYSDKSIMKKLIRVDFLFLDDFGTEVYKKGNENDTWTNERVYEIINSRYERLKPIIFTSNLNLGDLVNKGLLNKTVDRISEMSTRKILVKTNKSLRT